MEIQRNREEKIIHEDILFPAKKIKEWKGLFASFDEINEIRLRVNQPVLLYGKGRESYITLEGELSQSEKDCKKISAQELQELMQHWCQNSRYAYEQQIKRGYLTLKRGHRVGLCGEAVIKKNSIATLKYISSVNIRIAHEIKGVSLPLLPYLYEKNRVKNILILSEPGAGKTTLLRDLIRNISQGSKEKKGRTVSLIDERKEIAACYQGIPQLDVGMRTDVLDDCPKVCGMEMVLRSMSPGVIAVDEIGGKKEIKLLKQMNKCGCSILATVHASCLEDFWKKKRYEELKKEELFDLIIELTKKQDGFHGRIWDREEGKICWLY